MKNLERLIREHAYWSDLRNQLRQEGSDEYGKCTQFNTRMTGQDYPETCIESAYKEWRSPPDEGDFFYGISPIPFDDFWEDHIADGQVCVHCQNVRQLKAKRAEAGRRLGVIRGAITRVGRRLLKDQIDLNNPF